MVLSMKAVATSFTAGNGTGGGALDGVDAAIAFSSSLMSAPIPSKRGVERYRSPVSGSIASMAVPRGAAAAHLRAAARVAPPLVPVKMVHTVCVECILVMVSALCVGGGL